MIALAMYLSFGTSLAIAQEPGESVPVVAPDPLLAPDASVPVAAPVVAPVVAPDPAPVPAPVEATVPDAYASQPAVGPVEAPPRRRRFVFAFLPGITAGVSPLPSQDFAFFFGGRLPRGPWALGYQFTYSAGLADRYVAGLWAHRHHLTAMRSFGARERGFASVGGGAAILAVYPVVEVETRVGLRFGARRRGIFAGLVRVGWNIGYREQAPMPQLGLVLGVALL